MCSLPYQLGHGPLPCLGLLPPSLGCAASGLRGIKGLVTGCVGPLNSQRQLLHLLRQYSYMVLHRAPGAGSCTRPVSRG